MSQKEKFAARVAEADKEGLAGLVAALHDLVYDIEVEIDLLKEEIARHEAMFRRLSR